MDEDTVERREQNVVDFYELTFDKSRPAEAIERFAGNECRQHNSHVADNGMFCLRGVPQ